MKPVLFAALIGGIAFCISQRPAKKAKKPKAAPVTYSTPAPPIPQTYTEFREAHEPPEDFAAIPKRKATPAPAPEPDVCAGYHPEALCRALTRRGF